jgi:integrase
MRRGELLGLTWRHIDFDASRLRVEQQLIQVKGGATFGPPQSQRSERTIALDTATVAALRHHRETQQLERDLAGPAYADQDLVFADELGGPILPGPASLNCSPATGRPRASRQASCTCSATPPRPLR